MEIKHLTYLKKVTSGVSATSSAPCSRCTLGKTFFKCSIPDQHCKGLITWPNLIPRALFPGFGSGAGESPSIERLIRHFDWLINLGSSCKKMAKWKWFIRYNQNQNGHSNEDFCKKSSLQAMCWFSCFEYLAKPAYLKICNRKFKKPVLQTFLRTKGYQQ